MGMRNNTTAITAESFERIFVRTFHNTAGLKLDCWSNDWRCITRKALVNKELGDALRRAVLSLPVKYREVLFLRDVKNLDTEDAAWILSITAGAVKAWLSRARNLVREALVSALSSSLSGKCSNLVSSIATFEIRDRSQSLSCHKGAR
jgi:DNA-directed RNA polymerase specialized sigma24 family protein